MLESLFKIIETNFEAEMETSDQLFEARVDTSLKAESEKCLAD